MPHRIAIADDDRTQSEYLKNLVSAFAEDREIPVRLSLFPTAEALLFDVGEHDIYLLDIEMPGMSGIDLAKDIRRRSEAAPIIFVTGYSDYIAEGYDVSALHYLLKPVNKDKLYAVLEKAFRQLEGNGKTVSLESGGEIFVVPLHEIRYLDVSGNYVTVHAKEEFRVKMTLGAFEKVLDDRFARTGRSFIVNLGCIRRITKTDVHLSGGETVPLSRGMYEKLNRALIEKT